MTHLHKFLGSISLKWRRHFFKKLNNIDNAIIRGEYKLAIYKWYTLFYMRYCLSVHNLHTVHLNSLDMLVKTLINKLLAIPSRGVTDVGLFHPYMLNCQLGVKKHQILIKMCKINQNNQTKEKKKKKIKNKYSCGHLES